MLATERHDLILREVRARGLVRLAELADRLGVSPVTVRRDVADLEDQGLVTRVHGGVAPPRGHARPQAADGAGAGTPDGTQTAPRAGGSAAPGAGESLTLGMLVPSATYYYPEVIKGARVAAARLGARLVLGISRYEPAEERAQVEQLLAGGVDGLLVTPCRALDAPEQNLTWLADLDVPAVLVERVAALGSGLEHLDHVATDHAHGGYLAVRHLAALGHRDILFVARRDSPTTPRVRAGYQSGLRSLGLLGGPPMIETLAFEHDPEAFGASIDPAVATILEGGATAVVVHNDQDALVLVQKLRSSGLRLPGDVSVVAYDDEVAALADPPLTAVAPPKHAVGRAAVELLVARVTEGEERPRHHLDLLPQLRLRESCGILG
ncbi:MULTISPECIES: substrate-binding domain-containing protein [Streptosporangium]|uniref:DNA-binding LacI/PurR family transcriptional regulator n=1 Tax=Streptosporangium brasiliense TaxID=47480 RepID=A0ABT9QZ24_9ACTN|nr:substrate-binding domain-containing protein [Streptosporangium brasiliense]MDP9862226.1 DNA-binding LacI/PurR family transcriptional regulator [Streptosporangium brasiliense]